MLNECRDVEGAWYAPEEWLAEQRDIKRVELWDTTSSAGDWDGYFVQKYNKKFYLILFWQENISWTRCFRLYTGGEPIVEFEREPTKDECDSIRLEYEKYPFIYPSYEQVTTFA